MDPTWSMLSYLLDYDKGVDIKDDPILLQEKLATNATIHALAPTGKTKAIECLWNSINHICDMPIANDIKQNKSDYCLYNAHTFSSILKDILFIDKLSEILSENVIRLVYREIKVRSKDIYYSDEYQIVIPSEVYDKIKTKCIFVESLGNRCLNVK